MTDQTTAPTVSKEIQDLVIELASSAQKRYDSKTAEDDYQTTKLELLAAIAKIEQDQRRYTYLRRRLWIIRKRSLALTDELFLGVGPGHGRIHHSIEEAHTPEQIDAALDAEITTLPV